VTGPTDGAPAPPEGGNGGYPPELAAAGRPGQIVIETSTLSIEVKQQARRRLARGRITLLDCPLSGTGAQARTRDLAIYASGARGAVRRCEAVFEGFACMHYHIGAFGSGSRMKFVANLLVAIHNVAAAEAVLLARKAGLNPATAVRILGDGAGASRMLQVRGPMMARRRYADATMKVGIWQKDCGSSRTLRVDCNVRCRCSPRPRRSTTRRW
jgi:3-hydroxyisobutyrate dehydrogenase-like beta-hydroxyacid dehydrogenase